MSDSPRVLILTYYWPPSGGAGVQRWLKFTKYLPLHGITPVIFTAQNAEYPVLDASLEKEIPINIEVIRHTIREPYTFYKRFLGKKKGDRIASGFLRDEKQRGFRQRLSVWIRGNLFIPDARKNWIKPSVRYLSKLLKHHPVNCIISTGPPHSVHLIALALKRRFDVRWIADFRDPWTKLDFYEHLKLTKCADRKHKRLERTVLTEADKIVAVTSVMVDDFGKIVDREYVHIANGYDEADFAGVPAQPDQKFTITHTGFINQARSHPFFWRTLGELCQENPAFARELKLKLIGKVDISCVQHVEVNHLAPNTEIVDYLPHHQSIEALMRSRVLYLPINNTTTARGLATGKLYEYLRAKRPILVIGPPDGEAGQIVLKTKSGHVVNFEDRDSLKRILTEWFAKHQAGTLAYPSEGIEAYSRQSLALRYAELIKTLTKSVTH